MATHSNIHAWEIQRSLAGYSPWAYKSEIRLGDVLSLKSGEGTGNPLQYSCLENPVDDGA